MTTMLNELISDQMHDEMDDIYTVDQFEEWVKTKTKSDWDLFLADSENSTRFHNLTSDMLKQQKANERLAIEKACDESNGIEHPWG
jgi:hypothetical protein